MAWEQIDTIEEYGGSYIKTTQGNSEPYTDFTGRFQDAHKIQIKDQGDRKVIENPLAF